MSLARTGHRGVVQTPPYLKAHGPQHTRQEKLGEDEGGQAARASGQAC